MSVTTTRTAAELQAACLAQGIELNGTEHREDMINLLREKLSGTAEHLPDPMKCKDLKPLIQWGAASPFAGLGVHLGPAYVAEPKLDGCRMFLVLGGERNAVLSGRRSVTTFAASDRSDNFPHLRDAVVDRLADTVLDGEILAPVFRLQTHTGNWTDSLLNASVALCNSKPAGSVATQERFGKARLNVFDVIRVKGNDVMHLSYTDRRKLLEAVVGELRGDHPDCQVVLVPQMEATAENIERAIAAGYEGVVIKSTGSTYKPASRSGGWYKVKTMSTADAFITGYVPGENSNTGKVGALCLSVLQPATEADFLASTDRKCWVERGGAWYRKVEVARVGNLTDLYREAVTDMATGGLKPELHGQVIEFMGQGVTKEGRVRHPHMLRLRPDKDLWGCQIDQLDVFPRV